MKKQYVISIILVLLVIIVLIVVFSNKPDKKPNTSSAQNAQISGTITPDSARKQLAGKTSPYLEFDQQEYENAKAKGKIIFLNFYANWCPICLAESPTIISGFNELTIDNVVGFRVNFNDSETDDSEKNLAKEFKVPYQHTKIIIKNTVEVSRSGEKWTSDDFTKAFQQF